MFFKTVSPQNVTYQMHIIVILKFVLNSVKLKSTISILLHTQNQHKIRDLFGFTVAKICSKALYNFKKDNLHTA